MDVERYNKILIYERILKKWNKVASDRTAKQLMISCTDLTEKEFSEIRALLIREVTNG